MPNSARFWHELVLEAYEKAVHKAEHLADVVLNVVLFLIAAGVAAATLFTLEYLAPTLHTLLDSYEMLDDVLHVALTFGLFVLAILLLRRERPMHKFQEFLSWLLRCVLRHAGFEGTSSMPKMIMPLILVNGVLVVPDDPPRLRDFLTYLAQEFSNVRSTTLSADEAALVLHNIAGSFARLYGYSICASEPEICKCNELTECPHIRFSSVDELECCKECGAVLPPGRYRPKVKRYCAWSTSLVKTCLGKLEPSLLVELMVNKGETVSSVAQRLGVIVRIPEPRQNSDKPPKAEVEVHIRKSLSLVPIEEVKVAPGPGYEEMHYLIERLSELGIRVLVLVSGVWVMVSLYTIPRRYVEYKLLGRVSDEFRVADILARGVNTLLNYFVGLFEDALSDDYFRGVAKKAAELVGKPVVEQYLVRLLTLLRELAYEFMPHYAY